jgi:hypothetical protein
MDNTNMRLNFLFLILEQKISFFFLGSIPNFPFFISRDANCRSRKKMLKLSPVHGSSFFFYFYFYF